MFRKTKVFVILIAFLLPMISISCAHHVRPPKPGPNFVWIATHTNPNGVLIHGHWRHARKPKPAAKTGKVWIKGHYKPSGAWAPGHWKKIGPPPNRGAAWIPGHRNARGHWVPGHWR